MRTRTIPLVVLTFAALSHAAPAELKVTAPPQSETERLKLAPFYKKYVSAGGFPVVGSAKVNDYALLEAAYLIDRLLDGKPKVRAALIESRCRFAVMAHDELTTMVPEHSDLRPRRYWDRRARGLGPTDVRPAVSCGEENLLRFDGDPYHKENILIHEFAHAIHLMGIRRVDPTFDDRLAQVWRDAIDKGLWEGKYAGVNKEEYWAECVQSWFDDNRENDHDHNHVNTRAELKAYDPGAAKLLTEVFGDAPGDWRYVRPEDRAEPGHLAGYDRASAPKFAWPAELQQWYETVGKKQFEQNKTDRANAARKKSE